MNRSRTAPHRGGRPVRAGILNSSNFALFKENPNFYARRPKSVSSGCSTTRRPIHDQALKAGQLDYAQFLPQSDAGTWAAGLSVDSYRVNVYFSTSLGPPAAPRLTTRWEGGDGHAMDRQRMVKSPSPVGPAPRSSRPQRQLFNCAQAETFTQPGQKLSIRPLQEGPTA